MNRVLRPSVPSNLACRPRCRGSEHALEDARRHHARRGRSAPSYGRGFGSVRLSRRADVTLLGGPFLRDTESRLDDLLFGNFRRGLGGNDDFVLHCPRGLGNGFFGCSLLFPALCHQNPPLVGSALARAPGVQLGRIDSLSSARLHIVMYETKRRRAQVFPSLTPLLVVQT
jgi:hypothetical protein